MLTLKNLLSSSVIFATVAALAAPVVAQEVPYDWTGFYVGAAVGAMRSTSPGTLSYGDESLISDWGSEEGGFVSSIYREVDLAAVSAASLGSLKAGSLDLDDMDGWSTSERTESFDMFGNVFAGAQKQFGTFVVGVEGRLNFGEFGAGFADEWTDRVSDSTSVTCTSRLGCLAGSTVPAYVALGWNGPLSLPITYLGRNDVMSLDGSVTQQGSMAFATSYQRSFSALGRFGIPVDRAMFYGVAGATVANVSATTSAVVDESGELTIGITDRNDLTYTADETYSWEGETSGSRVGLTFGMGVDYALTDNIALRGEVSYTNMGDISVTGSSEDTDATYTVSQHLGTAQATAGVMFKF